MEDIKYYCFTKKYKDISNRLLTEISFSNGKRKEKGLALWDTGASNTCISRRIVKSLKLDEVGFAPVLTPSGCKVFGKYKLNIHLPNNVVFKNILVCDSEIENQGIDALIGMDIINKGDFSISNISKTSFSFRIPSKEEADFLK